jgi:hypothetical protein
LREIRRENQSGQVTISFAGEPLSWMSAFMSPVQTMVEAFVNPATGRRIVR